MLASRTTAPRLPESPMTASNGAPSASSDGAYDRSATCCTVATSSVDPLRVVGAVAACAGGTIAATAAAAASGKAKATAMPLPRTVGANRSSACNTPALIARAASPILSDFEVRLTECVTPSLIGAMEAVTKSSRTCRMLRPWPEFSSWPSPCAESVRSNTAYKPRASHCPRRTRCRCFPRTTTPYSTHPTGTNCRGDPPSGSPRRP